MSYPAVVMSVTSYVLSGSWPQHLFFIIYILPYYLLCLLPIISIFPYYLYGPLLLLYLLFYLYIFTIIFISFNLFQVLIFSFFKFFIVCLWVGISFLGFRYFLYFFLTEFTTFGLARIPFICKFIIFYFHLVFYLRVLDWNFLSFSFY